MSPPRRGDAERRKSTPESAEGAEGAEEVPWSRGVGGWRLCFEAEARRGGDRAENSWIAPPRRRDAERRKSKPESAEGAEGAEEVPWLRSVADWRMCFAFRTSLAGWLASSAWRWRRWAGRIARCP